MNFKDLIELEIKEYIGVIMVGILTARKLVILLLETCHKEKITIINKLLLYAPLF